MQTVQTRSFPNNSAMFTDIIAQMVGDSDLATSVIPTKDYTLSAITVDAAAGILYGLGLMIVLPVIMMILGIVIWASRRKNKTIDVRKSRLETDRI